MWKIKRKLSTTSSRAQKIKSIFVKKYCILILSSLFIAVKQAIIFIYLWNIVVEGTIIIM